MQGPGPWAGRYTLPEQDERTLRIQGAAKRLFVSRHFILENPGEDLPRQARDKRRKRLRAKDISAKNATFLSHLYLKTNI